MHTCWSVIIQGFVWANGIVLMDKAIELALLPDEA